MDQGQFIKGHTPWNKVDHISKVCLRCNTEFFVVPSRAERAKYCSKSCVHKGEPSPLKGVALSETTKSKMRHKANRKRGKDHFNWRPWTDQSHRERVHFRDTMQRIIFQRDNYTCLICAKGGDLQVDHIKPWAKFPELRFDPNNCRTLCSSCHYKITFNKNMPAHVKAWGHNLTRKYSHSG